MAFLFPRTQPDKTYLKSTEALAMKIFPEVIKSTEELENIKAVKGVLKALQDALPDFI